MFTEDEAYLAEAQERMYKSEARHTWEHFISIDKELRTLIYGNTNHINAHIQATTEGLKEIFEFQEKMKKESIDRDVELSKKIQSIVEEKVTEELKNVNFFGDGESDVQADDDEEDENDLKIQKTQYELLKEEIKETKEKTEKMLTEQLHSQLED
jgi:hypothetical protein